MLFLPSGSFIWVRQETKPQKSHPLKHMKRNVGKENERLGLCGDILSLTLASNSAPNTDFPQEMPHESKEPLSHWRDASASRNYSFSCPKQVSPHEGALE